KMMMPAVPIEGSLGRWTEPHVVVRTIRRASAVLRVADVIWVGAVGDPGSAQIDVSQLARLNVLHCILKMFAAALLRTDLHQALVATGGVHHGPAFDDVVR